MSPPPPYIPVMAGKMAVQGQGQCTGEVDVAHTDELGGVFQLRPILSLLWAPDQPKQIVYSIYKSLRNCQCTCMQLCGGIILPCW